MFRCSSKLKNTLSLLKKEKFIICNLNKHYTKDDDEDEIIKRGRAQENVWFRERDYEQLKKIGKTGPPKTGDSEGKDKSKKEDECKTDDKPTKKTHAANECKSDVKHMIVRKSKITLKKLKPK